MKSKRRTITVLVTVATLVFFIAAELFLLLMQTEIESRNFTSYMNSTVKKAERAVTESDEPFFELYDIALNPYYPTAFAVIESGGKVIQSSFPTFIIEHYENDGEKYINSFSVPVEKYITPETEKQINDFVKSCKGEGQLMAKSVSLCESVDGYIPVEAVLYNPFAQSERTMKVRFTDKTPKLTVEEKDGSIIKLTGFYKQSQRMYKKYTEKVNENLKFHIESFAATHGEISYDGGGGISGSGFFQNENHIKNESKKYCVYIESRYSMLYAALKSDLFGGMSFYLFAVFAAAAIIMIFIISKVNEKNERLEKSREAFISAAAHELKTPIAVIAGSCECILENSAPQKNGEYVERIYSETKRMGRMVKTLLQYNKLSSGEKTEIKKVLLSGVVSERKKVFIPLIEAKNIEITENIESGIELNCNEAQIGIVIENLLSNAVKFTPENGEIRISAFELKGKTRFEIFNSGSGIKSEDAPHIWEELYSGDKARTENSTGMGLAVCRLIFNLQKLEYGFRNEKNGVTFFFEG